jgi:hypothetical protein
MEALREHYKGAGEISKHVTIARATLTNTNYWNKYTYTFERFATRMKTDFTVLEKHGEPYVETAKVRMLCDWIQMEGNQRIQIAKSQVMDPHANNFSEAVAYMTRKIAEIFPEAFDMDVCREAQQKQTVSEIRSERGRGRRGGGRNRARMGNVNQAQRGRGNVRSFRGQGRGRWNDGHNRSGNGPGQGNPTIMNSMDISDPRRTFSDVEFQQLGPNGRRHITTIRENDNNSRTVNEIVAWYYGPAHATPGGYGGIMELPQGLPPLPASVNEANARGGRHGARFGRAVLIVADG